MVLSAYSECVRGAMVVAELNLSAFEFFITLLGLAVLTRIAAPAIGSISLFLDRLLPSDTLVRRLSRCRT